MKTMAAIWETTTSLYKASALGLIMILLALSHVELTCDAFEASRGASSRSHRHRTTRGSSASGMLGVYAASAPLNSVAGSMARPRCQAGFLACSKDRWILKKKRMGILRWSLQVEARFCSFYSALRQFVFIQVYMYLRAALLAPVVININKLLNVRNIWHPMYFSALIQFEKR